MIKTVYFIVVAYGSIIDWAGPVPAVQALTAMEVCVKTAGMVQQNLLNGDIAEYGKAGEIIPVEDIKLGCYYVDEEPIIGAPFDD